MKEENVREWGMIHPLGSLAFSTECQTTTGSTPTPENLIYHFTSPFSLHRPEVITPQFSTLNAFTNHLDSIEAGLGNQCQALAINYGHPRFIEYPIEYSKDETVASRTIRPMFPILLAFVFSFVVWYIYQLTTRQIQLQSENNHYAETLLQEKQVAAELVAPDIKVLTFQDSNFSEVTAKVFWDTSKQSCQIYIDHLPQTDAKEEFKLWYFTKSSKFILATNFKGVNGSAAFKVKLPGNQIEEIDRIIVSKEPPGEYPFPVGKILLRGTLR